MDLLKFGFFSLLFLFCLGKEGVEEENAVEPRRRVVESIPWWYVGKGDFGRGSIAVQFLLAIFILFKSFIVCEKAREREREREGTRCVRVIRKERIKDQRERAREGARTKAKANEVGSNKISPRE